MASEPIQYFNRYTGRIETEEVYGDRFLRWTYGSPLGRLSLHALVKRAAFSRWYGQRMDAPASVAESLTRSEEFRVLQAMRDNVSNPPKEFTDLAVRMAGGSVGFFRDSTAAWAKQAAGLAGQTEKRNEADGDEQEGKERWASDFLQRVEDDAAPVRAGLCK